MNHGFSGASRMQAIFLCLITGFAGAGNASATELIYEPWTGGLADPPHPAKPFFTKGAEVQTTVLEDGSDGVAKFNYDNNNTTNNTGGARGSWQFSTAATEAGPVTLNWAYAGYHAEKKVYANLEVFVVRGGEFHHTPLVEAGPANCCNPPSGGFKYSGTTTVDVLEDERYGFRMAGSNSDQVSTLWGTLTVNVDIPLLVNDLADASWPEVDEAQTVTVDLSDAFSSTVGFELSLESIDSDDAALFDEVNLTGTDLDLTLAKNRNGSATITVKATTVLGSSALNSFTVTVTPVNDRPELLTAFPDPVNLLLGTAPGPVFALGTYFTDVDLAIEGDTLVYSATASNPGLVNLEFIEDDLLKIEGLGVGSTYVTVSAQDAAGASASASFTVNATDSSVFGSTILVHAVPFSGGDVGVAVSATGTPGNTSQFIELLTSASCEGGTLGSDAVVFAQVPVNSFDDNGNFFSLDILASQAPIDTYAAARLASNFSGGEKSACIVAGPDNDSWVRAVEIPLSASGEISMGTDGGFLDRAGNARWYKFAIQPGARATIDLSSLPADYDLFVFKDIAQAFQELEGESDVDGLNRLGAEFAPSTFAPSTFAPSVFAPSTFAPDAYSPSTFATDTFSPSVFAPSTFAPSTFAPSAYSPSTFAPSTFAPSTFAPSTFAPSTFAPSTFAPSVFAPENFVSAQIRSLIGVSAKTGTGSERVIADTWNNTDFFYVRVSGKNGAYDVENPFQLSVNLDGVECTGVAPITATAGAEDGGYESIILWDSERVADDPNNTPTDIVQLEDKLNALAIRTEVKGVLVDLAGVPHVQALHDQSDEFDSCPYAENLTARAIKDIVDEYRALNTDMAYVVIVGSDGHIPFFRYPDQGLLGPEQDYDPPVADGTQSQAALRLNYVLSQDEYGAAVSLSLLDVSFPLPELAVGRLVETAAEMNTVLAAYLATAAGVIDTPTSTLVTGYDFLEDAANAVQFELVSGTAGARNDTLITPAEISPADPLSWTADDLRRELLDEGEDIVFLAGHFSANSALAADYKTIALTTELAGASTDFTNAIVFSAGCHSGYNIVNEDAVPGVTEPLDWTQAFAQKGATLIAGTGYQYGDTDFVEYSERLYVKFAQELRTGLGPVSVGEALVRAKQKYLATTPDIRGLHRKSLLISTVFGLPMLSVNMPGERIIEPVAPPTIVPELISGAPGETLGLQFADLSLVFDSSADGELVDRTVQLTNLEGGFLTATYLEGADGVVTNPAEPAIPLVTRDVTAVGTPLSLRGVGLRSGAWRERQVLPLSGAPTTELRGVHTPFTSPVNFPMRLATTNYFDALAGGGTTLLHVTPAQHREQNLGDFDATLRQFDDLSFRLFYSDNTQIYSDDTQAHAANIPALSGPPTMSGVQAVIDGPDIVFLVNVVGDPAAGIHAAWVTYTEGSASTGQWISLDLDQDPDDSTLWSRRLLGAAAAFTRLDYVVQAVSGTGLVTLDDNFGAYYHLAGELGEVGSDGKPIARFDTEMSLSGPDTGAYGSTITVDATLSSDDSAVEEGTPVLFTIGGTGRVGTTDSDGDVLVSLPLTSTPGDYTLTVSFAGNDDYAPSSADKGFTITKTGTSLTLLQEDQVVGVDGVDTGVFAELKDAQGTPLLQRTVYFTIDGGPDGTLTVPVITDIIGRARLGEVALPQGNYVLTARFLGTIPTGDGVLELDDPVYESSIASADPPFDLIGNPDCPTEESGATGGKNGKGKGKGNAESKLDIVGFCYLMHDVRGKIEINEGTLIVGSGVTVDKKIDQRGAGSVLIHQFAYVGNKIDEQGPGDIIVDGSAGKKLKEQGPGGIHVGETGTVGMKINELDDGSIVIKGSVDGSATEEGRGDLVITPTGSVDGDAIESGEGQLSNDGWVSGFVAQD
jgi:hypothetical protein